MALHLARIIQFSKDDPSLTPKLLLVALGCPLHSHLRSVSVGRLSACAYIDVSFKEQKTTKFATERLSSVASFVYASDNI